MKDRTLIATVAALSVATVAIGLRVGAGETVRAAIVIGAPPPRGGGRIALQLRTEDDDGRTRSAISSPFSATIRARGVENKIFGATNADGVAELAFDAPGLAVGDAIDFDVRDDRGRVLARGAGTWPTVMPAPVILDHQWLRPSRDEGPLRMRVAILGGALVAGELGHGYVTLAAAGDDPRRVHVTGFPMLGLSSAGVSGRPGCSEERELELLTPGMSAALALEATDTLDRKSDWMGEIPVANGAFRVDVASFAPLGPLDVIVTAPGEAAIAYVELDDEQGRAAAATLALSGDPANGHATFDLRHPGIHFVVVSASPDGAARVAGPTRALPVWAGPRPACEADLAEHVGRAFPRFVMLDGFTAERARLASRKRKGRLIALLALALGSFLETVLLLRAAREGRRRMKRLQNAMIQEAVEPGERLAPRSLDLVVVIGVSLLGFALLFALVAAFATK